MVFSLILAVIRPWVYLEGALPELCIFRVQGHLYSVGNYFCKYLKLSELDHVFCRVPGGWPVLAGLVYARVGLGLNSADVRMGGDVNRRNGRRFGRICRPSGAGERWKRKWMVRNSFWRACAARCG